MVKVLIADDHAVVRRGIRQILDETSDFRAHGEATNAEELVDCLQNGTFDLVLLDLNMPGRSGLDVLKDLKRRWPSLPVLVLSMHAEEQFAARVLKAGASGYLNKESATEELVSALRKVVQGGKYISSRVAESLAVDLQRASSDEPHRELSDREFEVLCLIASGKTVTQISRKLALSVKTVSTYRQRVLTKMNLTTNSELTRYVLEKRLID